MLNLKHHTFNHLRWIVGNGEDIDVFQDIWIQEVNETMTQAQGSSADSPSIRPTIQRVRDLITKDQDHQPCWNIELFSHWWSADLVDKICFIPLGGRDIPYWKSEKAESCSYKALYHHFRPPDIETNLPWKTIWCLQIPSKQKIFLWKCLHNRLPTRDRLHKISSDINPICALYHVH